MRTCVIDLNTYLEKCTPASENNSYRTLVYVDAPYHEYNPLQPIGLPHGNHAAEDLRSILGDVIRGGQMVWTSDGSEGNADNALLRSEV